jgi:hypothetical protein
MITAPSALGLICLLAAGNPSGLHRVGEPGMVAPAIVTRVEPELPQECGTVKYESAIFVFRGVISEDGRVTNVQAVKPPKTKPACPSLERSYLIAISKWRYKPAMLNGKPVAVELTVTVGLHLK